MRVSICLSVISAFMLSACAMPDPVRPPAVQPPPTNAAVAPTQSAVLPAGTPDPLRAELDGPLAQLQVDTRQLFQRLVRLTDDKQCQTDNQCEVLPVGNKPCGGPEQYMAYSTTATDQKLLQYTQERYSKLKTEQQKRLGVVSTCQILPKPTAICQAKQCVIKSN